MSEKAFIDLSGYEDTGYDEDVAENIRKHYRVELSDLSIEQQRQALQKFFFGYNIDGLTDFEVGGLGSVFFGSWKWL